MPLATATARSMQLYTATAHGLYAPTAPSRYDDAVALATQRARLFGIAEIVVVERGCSWPSHAGADRRYRERAADPDERPVLRLVARVHPHGGMQLCLRFLVRLHDAPATRDTLEYAPVSEASAFRQLALFPPSQE